MYVIGLTGGIASGKSTVSKVLAELGACIIDADKIAREIVEPGAPAWFDIVAYFGEKILNEDETLNRKKLGALVFKNKQDRDQLEKMTHPHIKREIRSKIEFAREAGTFVTVLDIPLLFEVGWFFLVDEIWVVYVSPDTQVKRLMLRDQLNLDEAMKRIQSQMSLEAKAQKADCIIDNDGDFSAVKEQIVALWQCLQNRINKGEF